MPVVPIPTPNVGKAQSGLNHLVMLLGRRDNAQATLTDAQTALTAAQAAAGAAQGAFDSLNVQVAAEIAYIKAELDGDDSQPDPVGPIPVADE